mgnify:CR=1 FL=1
MSDTATTLPTIAITRRLPGTIDPPAPRVVMHESERAMPRDELLRFVRGATAVVTWVSERVDAAFLDAAGPSLKGVCNYAVGTDNIDLAACKDRGVIVTNTPDAVTEGTADLAFALILAVARRLIEADAYARSDVYPEQGPLGPTEFLGQDLTGKTILIVGAGRIGRAVALRSLGWGMRVLYVARTTHLDFELAPIAASRVSLDDGLAAADVVSIHTPLTPQTRGLIGARQLALLKPTAILVNTARGPIVDEAALVDALGRKRLWGAGLDVFEREPIVHPGLKSLTNATLTPHIGSGAIRFREMMTRMALANAGAVVAGREPPNRVC